MSPSYIWLFMDFDALDFRSAHEEAWVLESWLGGFGLKCTGHLKSLLQELSLVHP